MNDVDELTRILDEKSRTAVGSEMMRFQKILPSLVKARAAGIKHKELWEELKRNGFTCTFSTYMNFWARAKNKPKHGAGQMAPLSSASQVKPAAPAEGTENVKGSEYPPPNESIHSPLVQRVRDGIPDPPYIDWKPGQKLGTDW